MSAVPVAYQNELMLAGWGETHNGGAKVTFWLPDAEAIEPFRHLTVKKGNTAGQRFMAVLVLLGDDDKPESAAGADAPTKAGGLTLSAVLLCKEPVFQQFVAEVERIEMTTPEGREMQAKEHIYKACGITSRKELDRSPKAAQLFARLMKSYRDWANA